MSGGVGEESDLLLPTGPEAELGSEGLEGRREAGRVRTKLVVLTGWCSRRIGTGA